jgi:UDP-N-acetylglucosamine--N-acetylmuramyl-(pentapeptide) pyrophosphoryl-undecaprenol N-acetylglucosamine transferase
VRPELLAGQAERARAAFGFSPARPVVYLTGGARGSHVLNKAIASALPELVGIAQLVHQTGPAEVNGDLPRLAELAAGLPEQLRTGYRPVAFVGPELPDLFALASLVVGRAGAGTVAELAALGKPALLIPLPGTSADEQTRNAVLLAGAGAAVLLPEPELTPARLTREVAALLAAPDRLVEMGRSARRFACPDAAERLVDHLLDLADA